MDFGSLPPEVNSERMYSGPGAGPLLAAAAAWDGLASELGSTASAFESVISGLTGEAWSGPSAKSMSAAATPYAAWMASTAAGAEQAATHVRAAAAAYDAAFTATVPPPVIAANRSLSAALVATNVLGQNTAAIAATEAHYIEMWAQDALAMYGYAGASASATQLTSFTDPPAMVNPAGLSGQSVAMANAAAATGTQAQTSLSQLVTMVPPALQGLATATSSAQATGPVATILDALSGPLSPLSSFGIVGTPLLQAIQDVLLPMNGSNVVAAVTRAQKLAAEGTWVPPEFRDAGPRLINSPTPVAVGVGNAGAAGRLSVPQNWTAATGQAVKPVVVAVPGVGSAAASMAAAESQSSLLSNLATGGLAGRAIGAAGGSASQTISPSSAKVVASKPGTATIIVIPPSAED